VFCKHILEHDLIQRQLCHQPLELRVLLLQLLALPDLLGFQAGITPFPSIEGLLGNPEVADQVRNRCP
jgi:hypothetical protein